MTSSASPPSVDKTTIRTRTNLLDYTIRKRLFRGDEKEAAELDDKVLEKAVDSAETDEDIEDTTHDKGSTSGPMPSPADKKHKSLCTEGMIGTSSGKTGR